MWKRLVARCFTILEHAHLEARLSLWRSDSRRVMAHECYHNPLFHAKIKNQWSDQIICQVKKGGRGAVLYYQATPDMLAKRQVRAEEKKKAAAKKSSTGTIEQRAARQERGPGPAPTEKSVSTGTACPRSQLGFYQYKMSYGQVILRCKGWDLKGEKNCKVIQPLPGQSLPNGPPSGSPGGTSASGSGSLPKNKKSGSRRPTETSSCAAMEIEEVAAPEGWTLTPSQPGKKTREGECPTE